MDLKSINLTGHFLIAMPNMQDPFFAKSVTFICTHNEDGAMGIIINRPTDMSFSEIFEKIDLSLKDESIARQSVLFGGPVQPERGFVLHPSADHTLPTNWDSSITIAENTLLTTSKDILEAIAKGEGPTRMILSLGYAGWTPGQLEQEILKNAWLSVEAKDMQVLNKIMYETAHTEILAATIQLLGIDPAMLSSVAGHA